MLQEGRGHLVRYAQHSARSQLGDNLPLFLLELKKENEEVVRLVVGVMYLKGKNYDENVYI